MLFIVVFTIDGATRAGYQPKYHPVSALALGPRGWVQATNFILVGAMMTLAAIGGFSVTTSPWGPLLLTVFGLSLIGSGVFPMDPMRGYPPGTPDDMPSQLSVTHRIHDLLGPVVFVSLIAAAVAFAFELADAAWAVYSGVAAAVLGVLLIVFATAWQRSSAWSGLLQRGFIVVGWTWVALICIHLIG